MRDNEFSYYVVHSMTAHDLQVAKNITKWNNVQGELNNTSTTAVNSSLVIYYSWSHSRAAFVNNFLTLYCLPGYYDSASWLCYIEVANA